MTASSYSSPFPSLYGRTQSQDAPDVLIRQLLRKAFLDIEGALSDWDEASEQGLQVLRALVNAGDRLRDFSAAEGHLGLLSRVPGAEDALRTRLIRSMERLHRALHPQVAALATACNKLDKIVNNTLEQVLELQAECEPAILWASAYAAQPSIAEMQEWLQDIFNSLRRELAVREELMREVGCEEGMNRAVELWESRVWFDHEHSRSRLDIVRIHGVA